MQEQKGRRRQIFITMLSSRKSNNIKLLRLFRVLSPGGESICPSPDT